MAFNGEYFDREAELKAFDGTKGGVKGLVDSGITKVPRIFIQPPENLQRGFPNSVHIFPFTFFKCVSFSHILFRVNYIFGPWVLVDFSVLVSKSSVTVLIFRFLYVMFLVSLSGKMVIFRSLGKADFCISGPQKSHFTLEYLHV